MLKIFSNTLSDLPLEEDFVKQQPHVFQKDVNSLERGRKFDALPGTAMIWVFHATDSKTADEILKNGLMISNKRSNLARTRYEQGEYAEFAPGRGLSHGTYVGANPQDVSGYGRRILAFYVQKSQIGVSPEQKELGEKSIGNALALGDAVLLSDVPPENIFEVGKAGRYPGSAYTELQNKRRPV